MCHALSRIEAGSRAGTPRDSEIAEEEEQKDNEKQPENADPDDMDSLAMISENS